jgi:hypothetical protein
MDIRRLRKYLQGEAPPNASHRQTELDVLKDGFIGDSFITQTACAHYAIVG